MTTINFEIERLEGRGIVAKVTSIGKLYSTYSNFAKASGYPDAVGTVWTQSEREKTSNARLLLGKTVKVLAKGKHESYSDTIYVVESDDGERFLFGEYGLEIIEKGDGGMKQIDEMITQVGKLIHKAYAEGYEAGKFDAAMNRVAEVANEQTKETPQQARDSIVEQAKADIEKYGNDDNFQYTFYYENHSKDKVLGGTAAKIDFVVNREKRTVVCLVKNRYFGSILAKGIAKCAPSDCFNVHIGKAIALRRALGLKVPQEYLNAPQPTEVRIGDLVNYNSEVVPFYEVIGVTDSGKLDVRTTDEDRFIYRNVNGRYEIIDDSREESE